eukprot:TRINITY_DN27005_c0_g1_i1.p1 TRINITY_DN27005_c0_g1~~TRINITY_DN27005_c0_g1_i1.p1  ORF type:complete len:540 (-),score=98.40 TRINITY_DN27005_c0_g1_i1:145-1764(-)
MSFLLAAICRCHPADKQAEKDSDAEEPAKIEDDSKLEVCREDVQQVEQAAVTPVQKPSDDDKASDHSTVATATGGSQELPLPKVEVETKKTKAKAGPEHLTTLAENNFDDRGTSSLDVTKSYTYTLHNDYTATLTGWTHTRPFARGFVRTSEGAACAVVSELDPGVPYLWKVYQVAAIAIVTNGLTVNGEAQGATKATHSEKATASGRTLADASGKITFTFSRDSNKVTLSGLAVAREEAKEGKKPKAKAKVKAKAKSKTKTAKSAKKVEYDEMGRIKSYDVSSSESENDNCPSSKKASDFEKELKKMKKKTKGSGIPQQSVEMDNPWLYTRMSEPERKNKRDMFKSFYREMYSRISKSKQAVQPDLTQYQQTDQVTGETTLDNSGLKAEGGHRPMPRPEGVQVPDDFRQEVGRVDPEDLVKKYGYGSKRLLISVDGDIFDVSDRPDKYGENGPYWYMTGKDITWGLVCGEDSEENMDKFFDLFKIQPAAAAEKRLQGLMSWWAFYEKEYGSPVGRNTAYDNEWSLPEPPNSGENCSIM